MNRARSADRLPSAPHPKTTVLCRIDPADVEAMLDAYDSGMCDTSTGNCVSRAVARRLHSDRPLPLIRHSDDSGELEIAGGKVSVPAEVLAWLRSAELGGADGPIEFGLDMNAATAPMVASPSPAIQVKRPSPHHRSQAIA